MKTDRLKCLIIMDGFGKPENPSVSAITKENTKFIQKLSEKYPSMLLNASEDSVGLPEGQTGTSDVGHLTIGTGRVKYQPLVEINRAIKNGEFFNNGQLMWAINNAKKEGRSLHLMGIPTDGGVHGHIEHLKALIKMCAENGLKDNVFIHYFTDGRDAPVKSACTYLDDFEKTMQEYGCGKVATIIGRVYALDRDNNWDRVGLAYNAMVFGDGIKERDCREAIQNAYSRGETDEFIMPIVMTDEDGKPVGLVKKGDSVISYNYRADREKQLARAFDDGNDLNFGTKDLELSFVCMTNYDESLDFCRVAFPPKKMTNILSEILSERGYRQLKVAETEKYPYVTFAFNDGRLEEYEGEDRVLINSVKMKSYAGKPEMSAYEVAEATVQGIEKNIYDVVVVNFANCDMVGHSGDIEATKKAVQVVDECVEKVVNAVLKQDGVVLLTADHGNADCMILKDGSPCTAHTKALVPFFIIDEKRSYKLKESGTLADVAPTLLKLLGEEVPAEMTGSALYEE